MSHVKKIAEITVHDGRKIAVWLPTTSERTRKYVAIALGPSHRIHRDNLTAEQALELAQALIQGATQVLARRSDCEAELRRAQCRIERAISIGEKTTKHDMLAIAEILIALDPPTSASDGT